MKNLRRSTWNEYRTSGFTYDVANDQASSGGLHHHEVRKTRDGWEYRICQSNGDFFAYSPTEDISEDDGENRFQRARQGNEVF